VIPGSREPEPPGDQTFWKQQVSGPGEQELDWDLEAGAYRFVLMNADGSAGVNSQVKFALKIPFVSGIMIGLLVWGGIVAVIGLITIILGIRSGRSSAPSPQPQSQPPAAAPPPEAPPPESTQ
jgi:hypothetical protein